VIEDMSSGFGAPATGQSGRVKLLIGAFVPCLVWLLAGPSASVAGGWTRIAWSQPKISETTIACFHEARHRYTRERHPGSCAIAGYRGEGRKFVAVPVKEMVWGHWGAGTTRAAQGVDARTGVRVRVVSWRRIRCANGRTEYSAVSILDLRNGHYFVIRPTLCFS
jgi:hypothetical protein